MDPAIENLLAFPPQIFIINATAISKPSVIESGSIPLSNLYFASELIFSSLDVFLTDVGKKYADSNKIFLVSNSLEVLAPPIMPPNPSTPLLSVITHIPLLSL